MLVPLFIHTDEMPAQVHHPESHEANHVDECQNEDFVGGSPQDYITVTSDRIKDHQSNHEEYQCQPNENDPCVQEHHVLVVVPEVVFYTGSTRTHDPAGHDQG